MDALGRILEPDAIVSWLRVAAGMLHGGLTAVEDAAVVVSSVGHAGYARTRRQPNGRLSGLRLRRAPRCGGSVGRTCISWMGRARSQTLRAGNEGSELDRSSEIRNSWQLPMYAWMGMPVVEVPNGQVGVRAFLCAGVIVCRSLCSCFHASVRMNVFVFVFVCLSLCLCPWQYLCPYACEPVHVCCLCACV